MKKAIWILILFSAIYAGEAELKKAWGAATAAGKKGNWTEAARLYAQAYEANTDAEIPAEFFYDHGDALMGAGQIEYAIEKFLMALNYATLKRPDLAAYNIACANSKVARFSEAEQSLQWAIYLGYKNIAHLEKDSDLAGLRGQASWPALLARLKSKNLQGNVLPQSFSDSIAALHKALKTKNEAAIMAWVMQETGSGFDRAKLLGILNQTRNLAFLTPISIKGKRGLAGASCQPDGQCEVSWNERPLGPTGGSTHTFVFKPENGQSYKLQRYECAGGCEP